MAVTLRLTRQGQRNRPYYRVVAAEHTARRDGRFIEIIGTYNPLTEPPTIALKEDRVRRWIDVGATQSGLVRSLISKSFPGLVEEREKNQRQKIQARRKKRKAALSTKKKS